MASLGKPKILLVDDDPEFLETYRLFLSRHFEVSTATDGKEAIEALKGYPEAIVLDLKMPEVSGYDVLDYMQLWPKTRDIPVIIVTSSHLDRKMHQVLDALANVCHSFEKTVSPRTVADETQRMVLMGELYRDTPRIMSRLHHMSGAA